MPELTGIEVARKTVNAGFRTRVVVLTMLEDPATALVTLNAI
jgi:DNA-binding NarL/FixJ family response regulator